MFGYIIVKALGVAHGLSVRPKGVSGKFASGIEGMEGGEVISRSSEVEKARQESLKLLIEVATRMDVNKVIGGDFETSDILQETVTLFSAYGNRGFC